MTTLNDRQIGKIVTATLKFPRAFLGLRRSLSGSTVIIRSFQPEAEAVSVIARDRQSAIPMKRIGRAGVFEAVITAEPLPEDYRLRIRRRDGDAETIEDPYNPKFGSLLTDYDLNLIGSGRHWQIYEKLGGRLTTNAGVSGVNFCVWAPNARSVSVTGSFNGWNDRSHPMQFTKQNGIWELFVPGVSDGCLYKFVIRAPDGKIWRKSDPYALASQLRPKKSSAIVDLDTFRWGDDHWLARRRELDHASAPMSIYEVHLGSWLRRADEENPFRTYRDIADRLVPYVKAQGFTHIELMPVMEHPLDQSWGYQVTSYYAPTRRFGKPEDLMYLINKCHMKNIGVILDWVPAHFPRDPHGLGRFDGTHLYEHADPRRGFHPDWKTNIFNVGRFEVRNFLLANALFWLEKYHIDGLRVDAVASMLYLDYSRKAGQWLPNQYGGKENLEAISFLRAMTALVRKYHPGVMTIAEESTAWPGVTRPVSSGGLGFHFKWNMGWMHDSLEYFKRSPNYRSGMHDKLTFMFYYAFSEKYILVLSHDEVVHGKRPLLNKMPGKTPAIKFANLRLLYGFMYAHPGKKLLFMGSELAMKREWSESRQIDRHLLKEPEHRGIYKFVRDLNRLHAAEPCLHEKDSDSREFQWLISDDRSNSVIAFRRLGRDGRNLVFMFNFSLRQYDNYQVKGMENGRYAVIMNSNHRMYGGEEKTAIKPAVLTAYDNALELSLMPLSMLILKSG